MPATLSIETAGVFEPLLYPARYKGAHGGRGSAKSWFFADLLIERLMLDPNTRAACLREVQKSLDDSVKQLIEDRIKAHGVESYFRVLNTHIEAKHGEGYVLFQGMNTVTANNIKSVEGLQIAWFEEAQTCSHRSLEILRPTVRVGDSELWFSWNPRFPTDPVDALLRGPQPPTGAVVVKATYLDNPWFGEPLLTEMLDDQRRDYEKYEHVWLGEYERHSEARVFKNWRKAEFETPADAQFYFGADWGFSVDPTVMVRCYIHGRTLYVDREVFKIGCEIDHIPLLFDGLDPSQHAQARRWPVTADSARPETISYLQRHGYPHMRAAKKGAGSVEDGIAFLQSYDIVVHPRCEHTLRELSRYSYKRDKLTNEVLPILEDDENHVIDSLRYALENVRANVAVSAAVLPRKAR